MKPDPTRHEASRPAFEALHHNGPTTIRCLGGEYAHGRVETQWRAWQAALDHAAAQACGWTHDKTNEEYDTDCARSFRCVVYGWDCVPGFCPGCGRRVKILTFDDNSVGDNQKTNI